MKIFSEFLFDNNILNVSGTQTFNVTTGAWDNTTGGQVNTTLTPGLSRLRRLTIFPFMQMVV